MKYIYNECNLCYMFRLCESIASSKQHGGASKGADVKSSHIIVYVSGVVILVFTSIFAGKKTKNKSHDCTFYYFLFCFVRRSVLVVALVDIDLFLLVVVCFLVLLEILLFLPEEEEVEEEDPRT